MEAILRLAVLLITCGGPVESVFLGRYIQRVAEKSHEHQTDLAEVVISSHTDASSDVLSAAEPNSSHGEGPRRDEAVRHQIDQAEGDASKITDARPMEMFKADIRMALDSFMPGRRPQLGLIIGVPLVILSASILWLSLYLVLIYKNDRASADDPLAHWKNRAYVPNKSLEQDERLNDIKPDYILVFHHPKHPCSDHEAEIAASAVQACIVQDRKIHMDRVDRCLTRGGLDTELTQSTPVHPTQSAGTQSEDSESFKLTHMHKTSPNLQAKFDEWEKSKAPQEIQMIDVREAFVQDICQSLEAAGFEVISFSSIDDDEIFVGISIENRDVIKELLIQQQMRLQLNPDVVKYLNIGQDPKEEFSSPPFMQYDIRLASNIMGAGAKDVQVYKTYHGKHQKGTIISSGHRIRLIHKHFSKMLDLDKAQELKILKSWFPVHGVQRVKELHRCWADLKLMMDLTFVQPMTHIHDYFGSRVAFNFAWHGVYCKMLLALLPVALAFLIVRHVGREPVGVILCFSIVMMVWAKLGANQWQREQEFFKLSWDIDDNAPDYTVRPEFKGEMRTRPEDSKKKSLQYPRHLYMARQAVAWVITLTMAIIDLMCIYVWTSVFEGRMDMISSACLAIMIQVFTLIFRQAVAMLTTWENHKYQIDFYNSYLKKLICLQSVNSYFAFFFIAVKQQHTEKGCPEDDCIELLRQQLSMTLFIGVVMAFVAVAIDLTKVQISIWWENRQLRKELGDKEMPVRGYIEEQAKYEDFRIRKQIESMMQLVVSLGYVLIFGAVAPIVVLFCFCVFLVQLRTTAYRATTTCRRPLPRKSVGLGPIQDIVGYLMAFGMIFSGYLMVTYGVAFHGTSLITRVSGLLVWMVVINFAWTLTSLCLPPKSNGAELLRKRMNYVLKKALEKNDNAEIKALRKQKKEEKGRGRVQHDEHIMEGQWQEIPHLIDAVQMTPGPMETPRTPRHIEIPQESD